MTNPPRSPTSLMNEAHALRLLAAECTLNRAEILARAKELERQALDAPGCWVSYVMEKK